MNLLDRYSHRLPSEFMPERTYTCAGCRGDITPEQDRLYLDTPGVLYPLERVVTADSRDAFRRLVFHGQRCVAIAIAEACEQIAQRLEYDDAE